MEFFNVAVNFFRDGGFFLYPLALIFVVSVAISIERWIYLSKETSKNRSLWDEITPLIQQGNFRQALAVAQGSDAQVATVLKYGIARIQHARRREDIEKAMEESMLEIVPRLETVELVRDIGVPACTVAGPPSETVGATLVIATVRLAGALEAPPSSRTRTDAVTVPSSGAGTVTVGPVASP